jgi:uncharacterized protein (TIGR03083 family)
MDFAWEDSCTAFAAAAKWYVATTRRVGERWDEQGLGEWSVRDLVGHASRSFLTVEEYLFKPAETVEVGSPGDYVRASREIAAGPGVAQRGRDAGAALGDDPATAVAEIAARVRAVVDRCDGSEMVTTIVGGMRLGDYLPTRTFELAVHTADLAVAIGEPPDVPTDAAAQALAIVSDIALTDGVAGRLLLQATGRTGLAAGFSVL